MTDAEHTERLRKIETETEKIKAETEKTKGETEKIRQQIMQLEFQHKKYMAEADRRSQVRHELIDKKIAHLATLVGLPMTSWMKSTQL